MTAEVPDGQQIPTLILKEGKEPPEDEKIAVKNKSFQNCQKKMTTISSRERSNPSISESSC
jgi:hypothetical protein